MHDYRTLLAEVFFSGVVFSMYEVVWAANIRKGFGLLTCPMLAGQTTSFSHSKNHVDGNLCMLAGYNYCYLHYSFAYHNSFYFIVINYTFHIIESV